VSRLRLLVLGRSGQVASALQALASQRLDVVAIGRPQVDLAAPEGLAGLEGVGADAVVNAAAYTAVDRAEQDAAAAFALNADGAARLAHWCAARDLPLVHLSTDYVFDGAKTGGYREDDPTGPLQVYGASKLAGEQAVAAAGGRAAIVRTSWIYGPHGGNFVRSILRAAAQGRALRVVADSRGCPTAAADLADVILAIAGALARGEGAVGVFHAAGEGVCSWLELAQAALAESARLGGPSAAVEPISAAAYGALAPRPANSALDCARLAQVYGLRAPHWRASLRHCVEAIAATGFRLD